MTRTNDRTNPLTVEIGRRCQEVRGLRRGPGKDCEALIEAASKIKRRACRRLR